MIDFFASQPHYVDHLLPIWWALPPEMRGRFFGVKLAEFPIKAEAPESFVRAEPVNPGPLTVIAGYDDLRAIRSRQVAFVNHGVGQTYNGDPKTAHHPAFSGGRKRQNVSLFIEPGPFAGEATREAGGNVVEVGAPKLDPFHTFGTRNDPSDSTRDNTVAVTFHWQARLIPETDSAFDEFKDAVAKLAERYHVIGHAHPRAWWQISKWYEQQGIEAVKSFSEVMNRASLLVADNSSVIYEFASLGKPVVVLNSKRYRKDVDHGLRFWDLIPGPQVDDPEDLESTVRRTLRNPGNYQEMLYKVYAAMDGEAAKRAAEALMDSEAVSMADGGNPYAPFARTYERRRRELGPQFPLNRMRRIGASNKSIQQARKVWDSMESDEEQFAASEQFNAMTDVELRKAIESDSLEEVAKSEPAVQAEPAEDVEPEPVDHLSGKTIPEQQEAPNFAEMTIPTVLDFVGSSKQRAQLALDYERAREEASEGRGRKTLIAQLKRIIKSS